MSLTCELYVTVINLIVFLFLVCSEFFYLGGDYGAHEGRFESPGYPLSAYPRNTRCTWIIKVPQNHRVRLYFTDFDIESCHNANYNCSCDAVEVYNGELLISQRLAQFCGNELPPVVLSGGRYMRVDLVSDEDTGKKGFAAGFYSVSSDPVTPTTLDRNGGKFLKTKPTTRGAPSGKYPIPCYSTNASSIKCINRKP